MLEARWRFDRDSKQILRTYIAGSGSPDATIVASDEL